MMRPTIQIPEEAFRLPTERQGDDESMFRGGYDHEGQRKKRLRVDPAMTRLSKDIKQLLESLSGWSLGTTTDAVVSDNYVRFGNDFNEVVAAFRRWNIDMSELLLVPEDLRSLLEPCLSEEPCHKTLQLYLPNIRRIITGLLQGLLSRHSLYKRMSDQRRLLRDSRDPLNSPREIPSALSDATSSSSPINLASSPPARVYHHFQLPQTPESVPEAAYNSETQSDIEAWMKSQVIVNAPPRDFIAPSVSNNNIPSSSSLGDDSNTLQNSSVQLALEDSNNREMKPHLLALERAHPLEHKASRRYSVYQISRIAHPKSRDPHLEMLPEKECITTDESLDGGAQGGIQYSEESVYGTVSDIPMSRRRRAERETVMLESKDRITAPPHDHQDAPAEVPEEHLPDSSSGTATVIDASNIPVSPSSVTVFLKMGSQIKKAKLERTDLTLTTIHILFSDKFGYNPPSEGFPTIYIKYADSRLENELNDPTEIRAKSVLSLNIEPLDDVKEYIDSQVSSLTTELKDLKVTINSSNSARTTSRPSRFQQYFPDEYLRRAVTLGRNSFQSFSLHQKTSSGNVLSDIPSLRVLKDLKTQFDEIQNLRDDLGEMRQIYGQFVNQTKTTFDTLREQATSVRQMVSKIGGDRAYIDKGKGTLDNRSQNLLTRIEDLQDTVDAVKTDVLRRKVSPNTRFLLSLKTGIDTTSGELESLNEQIRTVKPMWKKTWQNELQNVVEEQEFLRYQEELVSDLQKDYVALSEILLHLEQVISLQQ